MKAQAFAPSGAPIPDMSYLGRVSRNHARRIRIRALEDLRDFLDANIAKLYRQLEPTPDGEGPATA